MNGYPRFRVVCLVELCVCGVLAIILLMVWYARYSCVYGMLGIVLYTRYMFDNILSFSLIKHFLVLFFYSLIFSLVFCHKAFFVPWACVLNMTCLPM